MIIDYREINGNPYGLPRWVMEKLESCPAAGEGVHHWMYHIACALRHYVEMEEARPIIQEYMTRLESPDEIANTLINVYSLEYSGLSEEYVDPYAVLKNESSKTPAEVERIYYAWKGAALETLKKVSNPIPDLEHILRGLYAATDWICVGAPYLDIKRRKVAGVTLLARGS